MIQILSSFVNQSKSSGSGSASKIVSSELVPAAICALVDACRECDANRAIAFQAGCVAPLLALIGVFAHDPEVQQPTTNTTTITTNNTAIQHPTTQTTNHTTTDDNNQPQ